MIRYEKLNPEVQYPYSDAVAAADYINGVFGSVANGTFTVGASATSCIMQVERGDDAYTANFKVKAGEHVRVADLTKAVGEIVNITADELPSTYEVGNKLASASTGLLTVGSGGKLKIIEVTDYGVRAVILGN